MRFAVMGAGALGSYIGARLAHAGQEVALIARGAHLAALRRDGLKVRGPYGDHDLRLPATDRPEEAGPVAPDRAEQMLRGVSAEHKTSMLRDLERGRRLEVDAIQGAILRVAEARSVPAPCMGLAYACLKFLDERAARHRTTNG